MQIRRTTVYNNITSPEKLAMVNPENIELGNDFIDYLISVDRAKSTIKQYIQALNIFWCWNLEFNDNTRFVDLTKRQISKFQNHALNIYGWSSARIRMVKSVCRSLENYILSILDEEYPDYRAKWDKIESPVNEPVRDKSVFTDEELQPLLDYLVEKGEYMKACFLSLAINSGRRKSELARFKVSYFDDDNLICSGALYKTPEKMTTKDRGSKGKLLYVYTLAKPFKPYLDLWLKYRKEHGIKSKWLFPKFKDGQWIDEQASTSTFDSYAQYFSKFLNMPWYPHSMRHNLCTRLVKNNIPSNVIKDLFGWSSTQLVDVYSDIDAEDNFEKYFGAEGIKQTERGSLEDL